MIIIHDQAQARGLSPEYIAYRDRVVAANGSISSAAKVQEALDYLAATPSIVQWLDTRHGVGVDWYSICGRPADGLSTPFGAPILGSDSSLNNERTLAGGAWNGGITLELDANDDYTWGMKYIQPTPQGNDGFFWGNRYGNTKYPSSNVWNYLENGLWRSYFNGDAAIPVALPTGRWSWVWAVKRSSVVTLYDETNTWLGSVSVGLIGELPLGIAGGTDSTGISSGSRFRYQAFIRAAAALTAAQRAAIMAI